MPSGRVHDTATLIAAGATSPVLLYLWGPERTIITSLSFVVSGLLFSPDLDLEHSRSASFWRNVRLGWLWWPYARLIPHRSPLSHHPIYGPLGRIAYFALFLFLIIALALLLLSFFLPIAAGSMLADLFARLDTWILANPQTAGLALAGFIGGGAFHSLLDTLDTRRKRILTFWRKHGRIARPLAPSQPRRLRRKKSRVWPPQPGNPYRQGAQRSQQRSTQTPPSTDTENDAGHQSFDRLLRAGLHTRGASLGLAPDGSEPRILPPPSPPTGIVKRRDWNEKPE